MSSTLSSKPKCNGLEDEMRGSEAVSGDKRRGKTSQLQLPTAVAQALTLTSLQTRNASLKRGDLENTRSKTWFSILVVVCLKRGRQHSAERWAQTRANAGISAAGAGSEQQQMQNGIPRLRHRAVSVIGERSQISALARRVQGG
eukprot:3930003-Rhodomonas_salina.2